MSFIDELKAEAKAIEEKAIEYGTHEIALLVARLAGLVKAALEGKAEVAAQPPALIPPGPGEQGG